MEPKKNKNQTGKHIMHGVLAVKDCPRCRRNLATGKKI